MLLTWYHVALVFGLPLPAAAFSARRLGFESYGVFAFALLLDGALGYAAFFVWLFSPAAGVAFDVVATVVLAGFWLGPDRAVVKARGVAVTFALILGIATIYTGVERLGAGTSPLRTVAETRWNLPGDDLIPKSFADAIAAGSDPRRSIGGDWLSSDRPPLQTGLVLLQRPFVTANAWEDTSYTLIAIAYQLAWIPALIALLATFGVSTARAAAPIALVAATGFVYVNSVFVWPKFLAAAFVLYALVALRAEEVTKPNRLTFAAAMVAFGLLSHGGIAFTLIGIATLALPLLRPANARAMFLAGMLFLSILQPWSMYRTVYDPPGDRLLKWHLAGDIPPDSRTLAGAASDAYRLAGFAGAFSNKLANVATLAGQNASVVDASTIVPVSVAQADRARTTEFYYFLASPAFLWFGIFGFAFADADGRRFGPAVFRAASIVAISLTAWCLLMFGPSTTLNHQGSYATNVLLDALLALGLTRLPWWILTAVAAAAASSYALMFVVPFSQPWPANGLTSLVAIGIGCAVLAAALLVAVRERAAGPVAA